MVALASVAFIALPDASLNPPEQSAMSKDQTSQSVSHCYTHYLTD
jgi:hypothetical protein